MRRKLWVWLVPLSVAAIPACASAASTMEPSPPTARAATTHHRRAVTVTPASGHRRTRFTVRFRAPQSASLRGTMARYYAITAHGPTRRGCTSSAAASVWRASAGARMHAVLTPAVPAGPRRWCTGTYHGRVALMERPICTPVGRGAARVCPMFVAVVRTVGRFGFRVR